MNTAISELLDYFNGKEPSLVLAKVVESLGLVEVRVVSEKLFSWLKRQQQYGNEKPLELKQQYTWCQTLPLMLEQWPEMNNLFAISSGKCVFRESVSSKERDYVRHLATEGYQPVIRVKKVVPV
jgi:hypothetical protein